MIPNWQKRDIKKVLDEMTEANKDARKELLLIKIDERLEEYGRLVDVHSKIVTKNYNRYLRWMQRYYKVSGRIISNGKMGK